MSLSNMCNRYKKKRWKCYQINSLGRKSQWKKELVISNWSKTLGTYHFEYCRIIREVFGEYKKKSIIFLICAKKGKVMLSTSLDFDSLVGV